MGSIRGLRGVFILEIQPGMRFVCGVGVAQGAVCAGTSTGWGVFLGGASRRLSGLVSGTALHGYTPGTHAGSAAFGATPPTTVTRLTNES